MSLGVLQEISKLFQKLQEPLLESFFCKVAAWNSLKKANVKIFGATLSHQKAMPTQRLLSRYFPVGFEKVINTTLNTSARLPLK